MLQYSDVMKKREIVLNDKAKIAAVIKELDEKKNEALKKAHAQVNRVRAQVSICDQYCSLQQFTPYSGDILV